MARILTFFLSALMLTSCGSKKVVYNGEVKRNAKKIENKSPKQTAKKLADMDAHMRMKVYVVQYAPLAQKEMKIFRYATFSTL